MILIFSVRNDFTTNEVCKWLDFYNQKYKVIYSDFFINFSEIWNLKKFNDFFESTFKVKISDVKVFWCRKWEVNSLLENSSCDSILEYQLRAKSIKEINILFDFFFNSLPKDKVINNFFDEKNSKLHQLKFANEVGLKIPQTIIVNSKKHISDILKNGCDYITKAMYESFSFKINDERYSTYTARINSNFNSENFVPSFVQKEIKKQYEVRTFIFGDNDYSMAIFSQSNKQTEVDYKRYDFKNPNRRASFKLPGEIKEKIMLLMKKLDLITGSIDFIVDNNNEFYFLEVNPNGQFGMVSKSNNYNLEHEFSKYLMNYETFQRD